MKHKIMLMFALSVLFSTLVMGVQTSSEYSFNIIELPVFNNDTAFVNASEFWVTDSLGPLSDANTTWFSGIAGVLSIVESQLTNFIQTIGNATWLALDGTNEPTESIGWGGQNLTDVENIFINNEGIVAGNLQVFDRLFVGQDANTSVGAIDAGDVAIAGTLFINETISIVPQEFGTAFFISNNGAPQQANIHFTPGSILNTTTGLFCDSTNNPFLPNNKGDSFPILFSNVFGTKSITMEILEVINSTCVDISLAIFGEEIIPDITVFVYATTLPPILAAFDKGFLISTIGSNPEASFKINVPKATGPASFEINSVIGASNTDIVSIFTDVNGSLDTRNLESIMASSVAVNGSVQNNFMITADLSNNNDGTYVGIELDLTSAGNNVTTTGLIISSLFDSLITSGQLINISQAYYDNTTAVIDVTNDFDDPDILTTLFQENDSTIYIGNTFNFTKMSFSISTGGSQSILPQFFYCNASNEWQPIVMADSTNGFIHSGSIEFINPTNRGECNKDLNNVTFANASSFLYVAIRRSEISITTPPVIRTVRIFRDSSKILIGNSDTINADTSFTFANEEFQPEGSIVHMVTSRDISGQTLINSWQIVGKNNSYSGYGNSVGVIPNYLGIENFSTNGIINMTPLSNYILLCNMFGIDCSFNSDTRGNAVDLIPGGPLLWTMGDLEVWQSAKIHKGLAVEGLSTFDMEGAHFDINNGTLHISTGVTFEQGFTQGESVTKFLEVFSDSIGIFTNLQSDFGNWISVINVIFCETGECARADGAGSGLVEMQTNVSTLDINETAFSFDYSLRDLVGSGEFSITVNNNVGSGDVVIFSDTTDNVVNSLESIALPSSMDNQSIVSITIICDIASSSKPERQCFLDSAKLNGTAITTTLINVSGFDSVIAFSSGINAADGFPERGIFYVAKNDTIVIRGTVIEETVIEQILNITDSIILKGEAITNWDNVSLFDQNVLLIDGSRSLIGNWDYGAFNITGTGRIGIGTSSPTQALDVNGSININGVLITSDNATFSSNATCAILTSPGGTVYPFCD